MTGRKGEPWPEAILEGTLSFVRVSDGASLVHNEQRCFLAQKQEESLTLLERLANLHGYLVIRRPPQAVVPKAPPSPPPAPPQRKRAPPPETDPEAAKANQRRADRDISPPKRKA